MPAGTSGGAPDTSAPLAVDIRGAMRMLGLGRSTVLALADAGELPRLRAGRTVRYAVADIERLVERMRAGETLLTGAATTGEPLTGGMPTF